MDLSVVIASIDAKHSIGACLEQLELACAGLRSEVVVCDASSDETVARAGMLDDATRLFRFPAGTLTPVLWAEGFRRSSGRIVAFTTGHCLVSSTWAKALVDALDVGATGAGGPLVIGPCARPLDWAVFCLRYAAFMPETIGSGPVDREIAGDNAASVGRRWIGTRPPSETVSGKSTSIARFGVRAAGSWQCRPQQPPLVAASRFGRLPPTASRTAGSSAPAACVAAHARPGR